MAAESKKRRAKTGKQAKSKDASSELRASIWSVVSFEKSEASGLSYAEAEQKLKELEARNFFGLCIITDEAAARISGKKF